MTNSTNTKICAKCHKAKNIDAFYRRRTNRGGIRTWCKSCSCEARTKSYQNTKCLVLTHYGNGKLACIKCGFNDIRTLSIDHINGGGNKHSKSIGRGSIYFWLKKNNFPSGYQTLCMNCQFIKRVTDKEGVGKQQLKRRIDAE